MRLRSRLDALEARSSTHRDATMVGMTPAHHRGLARLFASVATRLASEGAPPRAVAECRMLEAIARRAGGLEVDTPELAARDAEEVSRSCGQPVALPPGYALGADTPAMHAWRARRLRAYVAQYGPQT